MVVLPADAEGVVGPAADRNYYMSYGDNIYRIVNNDGTIASDYIYAGADGTIGTADDSYAIVNAAGVRMLGSNADDGSYFIAGADGDLGTGDDERCWPCPTIAFRLHQ